MKIGLIITPYKEEEEKKKEYIPVDNKRPWLNNMYMIKN